MDPFLNSQDPCDRYAPIAVRGVGKNYLVDVRGEGGCPKHSKADVTVRVAFAGGNPVFVNFIYDSKIAPDLMTLLAQLAMERATRRPHR